MTHPPLVFNLFFSSETRFKLPYVGHLFLRSQGIVASFFLFFSNLARTFRIGRASGGLIGWFSELRSGVF